MLGNRLGMNPVGLIAITCGLLMAWLLGNQIPNEANDWSETGIGGITDPTLTSGTTSVEVRTKGTGLGTSGSDELGFVHRQLLINAHFIGKIESLDLTDPAARAGLMVRQDLDDDSACVFVGVDGSGNVVLSYRSLDEGGSALTEVSWAPAVIPADSWFSMAIRDEVVYVHYSSDGINWVHLAGVPFEPLTQAYYGVAVASGDSAVEATANFKQMRTLMEPWSLERTLDASQAQLTGSWTTETDSVGWLDDVHRFDGVGTTGSARFTVDAPATAVYEAYLRWDASGIQEAAVDAEAGPSSQPELLSIAKEIGGDQWILLGTYELEAGEEFEVELDLDSINGPVRVDGVKLVRASGPQPVEWILVDDLTVEADGSVEKTSGGSAAWDASARSARELSPARMGR